jgi:hypothetical protein
MTPRNDGILRSKRSKTAAACHEPVEWLRAAGCHLKIPMLHVYPVCPVGAKHRTGVKFLPRGMPQLIPLGCLGDYFTGALCSMP